MSLAAIYLSEKHGLRRVQVWSRVWMSVVLTILFVLSIIFSLGVNAYYYTVSRVTIVFSILGYIWFLASLLVNVMREYCDCGKKDQLGKCVEIPDKAGDELPTTVENIYENDLSLKADLI